MREVIAVGAVQRTGARWGYSNYGDSLDVVAPSGNIFALEPPLGDVWTIDRDGPLGWNPEVTGPNDCADNSYTFRFGGTSSSAAQVAGIATLVLARHPDLSDQDSTAFKVRDIITGSARDLGAQGRDNETGYGLANAFRAVAAVSEEQREGANLKTGVAATASLELNVGSDGRIASWDAEGGLWRSTDASRSIFDGSLLVAHGPQPWGDTTVYHRFYNRNDPGQSGFLPVGELLIDTAKYGTGHGYAKACARMVTKDSVVGVTVEWIFPQNPDSDEFVLARYSFYTYDDGNYGTVSNVVAGILADLDVMPAARYGSVQSGVENQNGGDLLKGLIWQQGQDTAGHVPPNPPYTAERYRGGVEFIGPGTLIGAQVGDAHSLPG